MFSLRETASRLVPLAGIAALSLTACVSPGVPQGDASPSSTPVPTEGAAISAPEPTIGPTIRAMTPQELINFTNSNTKDEEKKIVSLIRLPQGVSLAGFTLIGACADGGCLPFEFTQGSGLIDGLAVTAKAAVSLGLNVVTTTAVGVSSALANLTQGMVEGYYQYNPGTQHFEEVPTYQGATDRAKSVIEFFRDSRPGMGVRVNGQEVARVIDSTTQSLADTATQADSLSKDQEGEQADSKTERKKQLKDTSNVLIVEDTPISQDAFKSIMQRLTPNANITITNNCQGATDAINSSKASNNPYEVAIFDYEILGPINGLECLKQSRVSLPSAVIIFCPGDKTMPYNGKTIGEIAYTYGANAVIDKKEGPRALKEGITKLFP